MKTLLTIIMIMFFVSCEQIPRSIPTDKSPPAANQGNEEVPVEEEEEPVIEPIVEPSVEEEEEQVDSTPYFINNSVYVKSFTFWGYKFKSQDIIDKNNYTVFKSSNALQQGVGNNVPYVYATILFKDGEQVKIQYYHDYDNLNRAGDAHLRDWEISDDMKMHIDGHKFGSFGWWSKIYPTLKNQDEIDDGILKYSHTETEYVRTVCTGSGCTDEYKVTDMYETYYYE